ncbi:hypothetical protein AGLY_008484 [Aphis glycines]|uniref:Uncharacterized protein n=1 Tax=Aphis glycines TaxID=307491 RepID=A0A6G0TKI9_APHGL|nr:hypothetical protein AGLY_008484 [Aphis glycines]
MITPNLTYYNFPVFEIIGDFISTPDFRKTYSSNHKHNYSGHRANKRHILLKHRKKKKDYRRLTLKLYEVIWKCRTGQKKKHAGSASCPPLLQSILLTNIPYIKPIPNEAALPARKGKCLASSLSSIQSSIKSLITGVQRDIWYVCSYQVILLTSTIVFIPSKFKFTIACLSAGDN